MELRHHPLLTYRGLRSWPPVWSPVKPREGKEVLTGEIGVLKHHVSNALMKNPAASSGVSELGDEIVSKL